VERDPKTLRFVIKSVRAGSPAEREGFLPGDILLKQNNILIDHWENYYRAILPKKVESTDIPDRKARQTS